MAADFSGVLAMTNSSNNDAQQAMVGSLRDKLAADRSRIQDLFNGMDSSGDGRVSLSEFREALHGLGHRASDDDIRALFEGLDLDRNGRVSYSELHVALRARPEGGGESAAAEPVGSSLAARRGVKALQPVDAPHEEDGAEAVKESKQKAGLKNKWRGRLGAALVAQRVLMTPLRKMRMRFSMQRATTSGPGTSTVTEVSSAEELANVAIWKQGNEGLYTEEALAERAAARTHKDVVAVLQVWWEAALRSLRSGGDERTHEVGKVKYVQMMKKIYKTVSTRVPCPSAPLPGPACSPLPLLHSHTSQHSHSPPTPSPPPTPGLPPAPPSDDGGVRRGGGRQLRGGGLGDGPAGALGP
jgi:hypothetical protein